VWTNIILPIFRCIFRSVVAAVQCMFSADTAEVFACSRLCVWTCVSVFVYVRAKENE